MSESCEECMDSGVIPVPYCNCGDGQSVYGHEPGCGFEPCPNGCPIPAPPVHVEPQP